MAHGIKRKRTLIIFIIVIAVLIVQTASLLYVANYKKVTKTRRAYFYGNSIANAIKLTLENTLEASESLKYFYLQYGEDWFDDFETIAENISKDKSFISSMYIAPKGVIQVAYPKEVNEATIGFKMMEDPNQGPRARLAKETGKITVAGPHNLVEGGVGFIIRNPVYKGGEFIGFTIIVLDWDRYVSEMLSNVDFSSNSYKYAVWKDELDETCVTDSDGYIFRNTPDSVSNKVDIEFVVPNDIWHLNVEPIGGWSVLDEMHSSIMISILLGTIVISLIGLTYLYFDRKKYLQKEKAKNDARAAFLNNMTHDVRTPLTAILGYTDLMTKKINEPEMISSYIDKIQKSGEYLLSIINNVLEVSRIDSGKETVDECYTDLTAPECSVAPLLENEINKKNLHFTQHMDIQHKYVWADMTKIKEISMNLMSNAIKYTPEGGSIHLEFKEIPCEKEGYATYVNTISDNGIGMSKEFQEKIFESFTRERNTTESKVIGTGLGMSIVKKLVDLMGGTIEVQSEPGAGSSFSVTLTHRIVNPSEIMKMERKEDGNGLSGKRVLLAEDNDYNAEIAEEILSDFGIIVERARDGVEVIDMYTKSNPGYYDLILMDIQMPNVNGYKATKLIRAMDDPLKNKIPIIAMTANAFEEDKKKAIAVGMNGHISKPIKINILMEKIASVL